MPIETQTKAKTVKETIITGCEGLKDGGRQRLAESHDLINGNRQTGKLTINYSQGAINSVIFEERENVSQVLLERLMSGQSSGEVGNAECDSAPRAMAMVAR